LELKLALISFFFPPDLSAGSFRADSIAKYLLEEYPEYDIHVITTSPNRYQDYVCDYETYTINEKINIHRINIKKHSGTFYSQAMSFLSFAIRAFYLLRKIKPNYLIGTSSRLMTAFFTAIYSRIFKCKYVIDLRDIFSETISEILSKKSKFLSKQIRKIFFFIEVFTFKKATRVNVVSEAFINYYQNASIDKKKWIFYPYGIDEEFLDFNFDRDKRENNDKIITYAGNIGIAQSLHNIVPNIAMRLPRNFKFIIIGSGNGLNDLKQQVRKNALKNIEIIKPMNRKKLLDYYKNSDYLFLHLESLKAFERVLPSKIFEYGATGIPIIAGLSGYSMRFVEQNLKSACLFPPNNYELALECLNSKTKKSDYANSVKFKKTFARRKLMKLFAKEINSAFKEN